MTDHIPITHLPMVCDCGEERRAAAEALMAEVYTRLGMGSEQIRAREVTPASFLDDVLMSLAHDLRGSVERIGADQWFVVVVEYLNAENLEERVIVQCDRAEYGLAAIWKHLADARGLALTEEER